MMDNAFAEALQWLLDSVREDQKRDYFGEDEVGKEGHAYQDIRYLDKRLQEEGF